MRASLPIRQKGNVLPYVLVLLTALLLAAQYVFNAYKASNESTRLQNTSDAAAYSVAAVYAQNYNFVALSNRALVANQITMAQVVTVVSWMRMTNTFAQTINDIGQYIPYISYITNIIEQIAAIASNIVEIAAPIIVGVVQAYIYAVSAIQAAAVPTTSVIAQEILAEVVERNDKDIDYSFATVATAAGAIAHLSELYGQNDCQEQANQVRDNGIEAGDAETIARCMQFRNVTLASRDGFTKDRTYAMAPPGMPEKTKLDGVEADKVDGFVLYSELSMERAGGTTMSGETPDVPFTGWTALDTLSMHSSTTYLEQKSPFSRPKQETSKHEERVKLGVGHAYVGHECSRCHHIFHEKTNYWKKNPRGSACTDPDTENGYGGGEKSLNDGAFVLMDVLALNCSELSEDYSESLNDSYSGDDNNAGLTKFYNLKTEGYVEEKDHLMIYLRKDRKDVRMQSETVGAGGNRVVLDRYKGAQNDAFHSAAAAAVYFRRGTDKWMLRSAKRLDGRMEFGNTYNPFWEPRLSKLTAAERASLEIMKDL